MEIEHHNILYLFIAFSTIITIHIIWARSGKKMFIRPIAGMQSIEDAIGRATEMGRSILFVPGSGDATEIQTLAGVSILSHVARLAARYQADLFVPIRFPLVYPLVSDTLKESYLAVGMPDRFKTDNVRYLSREQWGFSTGTISLINEQRPGAIFLMGYFQAESLILAEVGNHIQAIQIAGTAQSNQIPFFITTCDYTLIGEEVFAATAYLSDDPLLTGSIKAQDVIKLLIIGWITIGVTLSSFGLTTFHDFIGKYDMF